MELTFPDEIDVKGLVDYISERTGVKILYEKGVENKKITIRAPGSVPVSSLMGLLHSVLKMNGLALVDAELPGWKRIVTTDNLVKTATTQDAAEAVQQHAGSTAVTQMFLLKHFRVEQLETIIEPFLTQPGGNTISLPAKNMLIVTDHAANVVRIAELVKLLDQAQADFVIESYVARETPAPYLAERLASLVAAKAKADGTATESGTGIEVTYDGRTNQLILVGRKDRVDEILELAKSIDAPSGVTTTTYELEHSWPDRIDRLAMAYVDTQIVPPSYKSVVEDNVLIVTTTDEVHAHIRSLLERWDTPTARPPSNIRFYRLKNVPVMEVLETIRGITMGQAPVPDTYQPRGAATRDSMAVPGPNRPPTVQQPMQDLPTPPAVRPAEDAQRAQLTTPDDEESSASALFGNQARVTADVNSNTLIVLAETDVQRAYAELIEALDRRRPQVLIEAKVVIIDTTDDFTLGVELSGGDGSGLKRLFAFSSYGLSTVDPVSGALSLVPGIGFNGTLVDPDVADAVVRALSTHTRARVVSTPRILVNDNAEGELTSVAEVPFTSVNASNTVATTSFAGFAQAGTTVRVIPTISDDDHLQLDFTISLNSFTGSGGDGVPPPRQTDEVTSQVTVPDGHTIIVGGLNQTHSSGDITGIPVLQRIPIVRLLSSRQTDIDRRSTLFVFLRPIILREDKFRDLKFVSDREVFAAGLPGRFPRSEPLWSE